MALFQKKILQNKLPVTIDLRDDYFFVNGKQLTIPSRISDLTDIFGEPRLVADRNKESKFQKERICEKYNLSPDKYSEMDYYWDELGLLALTYDKKTVHCFWIKIGDSRKYPMEMPKSDFTGALMINGRPWQDVVTEKGGTSGTFKLKLGKLHAWVVRYGPKVKDVKQFQVLLNDDEKLGFFDD